METFQTKHLTKKNATTYNAKDPSQYTPPPSLLLHILSTLGMGIVKVLTVLLLLSILLIDPVL